MEIGSIDAEQEEQIEEKTYELNSEDLEINHPLIVKIKLNKRKDRPFRLEFLKPTEEWGEGKKLTHLNIRGPQHLGDKYTKNRIKKTLQETPEADYDEEDATNITYRLINVAEEDMIKIMTELEQEDMPTEDEFSFEEIEEEKIEKAEEIINNGNALPYIAKLVDEAGHKRDYARKINTFCSSLSKQITPRQLNLSSVGESGKGKSHLNQIIFKCIPNEYKLKRDEISPMYLFYLTQMFGEDCLNGKVLYYDDVKMEGKESTIKAVSDPGFEDAKYHGTIQNQTPIDLKIDGLPVVWLSSVEMVDDEQIRNRFMMDQADESEELDEEVSKYQKRKAQIGILEPERQVDYGVAKGIYRCLVEETKDLDVIVPFDWWWNVEHNRRVQPHFNALIHIIAKVNYKNRMVVDGTVFATLEDFYLAKLIFNSFLSATADQLTKRERQVLESVPFGTSTTRSDIVDETSISYGKVRESLNDLKEKGFINADKEGSQWVFWRTGKKIVGSCGKVKKEYLSINGLKNYFSSTLNRCESVENIGPRPHLSFIKEGQKVEINPDFDKLFDHYRGVSEGKFTILHNLSQLSQSLGKTIKDNFESIKSLKDNAQPLTSFNLVNKETHEEGKFDFTKEEAMNTQNNKIQPKGKRPQKDLAKRIYRDYMQQNDLEKMGYPDYQDFIKMETDILNEDQKRIEKICEKLVNERGSEIIFDNYTEKIGGEK